MKLRNLTEKIETDLLIQARDALTLAFSGWSKNALDQANVISAWKQYQDKIDSTPTTDWRTRDALRDQQTDRFYYDVKQWCLSDMQLFDRFRSMIELTLQKVARDYIEARLGQIGPIPKGERYEEMTKRNLYFLQHIVVDLDVHAKHKKTGKPKTSGGFFNQMGTNIDTEYARKEIDSQTDLAVHIKLFASEENVQLVMDQLIADRMEDEVFGESSADRKYKQEFLHQVLPTFVHEVVHMEQMSRKQQTKGPGFVWGISHTPDATKKIKPISRMIYKPTNKGSPKKNGEPDFKKGWDKRLIKPGRRGRPSRLPNDTFTDAEYIEYLGTDHEIEAHAAGAAAKLVNELLDNSHRYRYDSHRDKTDMQIDLNSSIDSLVYNLKYGGVGDGGSLDTYQQWISDKIPEQTKESHRRAYEKVWKLFMKKVMKHILSYKKPIPNGDYRIEYHPQARKGMNITYPANCPELGESAVIVSVSEVSPISMTEAKMNNANDTILVDGVERPRLNSLGSPIARNDQKLIDFWRWFANSKIVDDQGRPRVVYHGTNKRFTKFNFSISRQHIVWFSSSRNQIESGRVGAEGTSIIKQLYIRIEHPADWKQYDQLMLAQFPREGLDGAILPSHDGFDGFVFKSDQIRSAQ